MQTLAVIGLGLIGSSLCRAIKQRKLAWRIVGCDSDAEVRAVAQQLGFVDSIAETAASAAAGADLVMFATPPGRFAEIARAIAASLKPGSVVSDVGSTKQSVIADIEPHLPADVALVPGHPVAGTEHSGPRAGFAELFQDRWCILTPPPGTPDAAIATVADLWRAVGMRIETMDAQHHDRVLAITSHLPHLIAYTIVATATDLEEHMQAEVIKFSAGGFRDFTRIAASDPVMWRDVFLANREAVLEMLGRFNEDLTALQRAIRWGDGATLEALFTRTRAIRRGIIEARQAGTFIPSESTGSRTKEPGPT